MILPLGLLGAPKLQLFTDAGEPAAFHTLYTYIAGLDTPLETFSDSQGTTSNGGSVELDEAGRATIYVLNDIGYKFVLRDADGAEVWTQDNVLNTGAYFAAQLISTAGSKDVGDNYVIQPEDMLVTVDSSAGAVTIILPEVSSRTLPITIKNMGANVVTIAADTVAEDFFEGDDSLVEFDLEAASSPLFPTITLQPETDSDEPHTWWVRSGASGQGA